MNDRKQHVLMRAHQLFVDKGFQATSIQDILDFSGISKGTFYNYFSSKNELLMAIFKELHKKFEKERSELLIGNDPADIHVFIKQIELQVMVNRTNNLVALYEEVLYLNDVELKNFIKQVQLRMLRWVFDRFVDIFGEDKKRYLLDGAVLFTSILSQNLRYYSMAHGRKTSAHEVVVYSVNRAVASIEQASQSGEQLFSPDLIEKWVPSCAKRGESFSEQLQLELSKLKTQLRQLNDQQKCIELLEFIQDELLYSKHAPRRFIIESTLQSLRICFEEKLNPLEELIKKELGT